MSEGVEGRGGGGERTDLDALGRDGHRDGHLRPLDVHSAEREAEGLVSLVR